MKERSFTMVTSTSNFPLQNSRHVCPELQRLLKNDKAYKDIAYKEALIRWRLLPLLVVTTGHRECLQSLPELLVLPVCSSVQLKALLQCNIFKKHLTRKHFSSAWAPGVQCLFSTVDSVAG